MSNHLDSRPGFHVSKLVVPSMGESYWELVTKGNCNLSKAKKKLENLLKQDPWSIYQLRDQNGESVF